MAASSDFYGSPHLSTLKVSEGRECCFHHHLQEKFLFLDAQSSYLMFPVSSDAKADDLESTELQLAAALRHLTACHHCGAPSIEETKGSVPVNSSSPRQTDTVAASWKQTAQTGLMPARSHAPPLPQPINQAFISFLHQLPVILSADTFFHMSLWHLQINLKRKSVPGYQTPGDN